MTRLEETVWAVALVRCHFTDVPRELNTPEEVAKEADSLVERFSAEIANRESTDDAPITVGTRVFLSRDSDLPEWVRGREGIVTMLGDSSRDRRGKFFVAVLGEQHALWLSRDVMQVLP